MKLALFIIFLISPAFSYSHSSTSFSFSKEEGLREISSNTEQTTKNNSEASKQTTENNSKTSKQITENNSEASKQTTENNSKASEQTTKNNSETSEQTIKNTESSLIQTQTNTTLSKNKNSESKNETVEEILTQSISEDFAPQEPEHVKGAGFLDSFIENSSWFFQKKESDHKIGITPNYSHDTTEGHRLGFSLFSYSPKEKGYYLNTTFNKYLFQPYIHFTMSFIGSREGLFRSKAKFIYNDHYENYYGDTEEPQGMLADLNQLTKIYARRFIINYDLKYQEANQNFYFGLGAKAFFRKERKNLQDNKQYFSNEAFIFLRAFTGFDTRDNLKDPTKGAYHQVSFGCKANLSYSDSHCQGEGDFRFYFPLFEKTDFIPFKNSILAFRAFIGSSIISNSYSTKYSLGRYSFFQDINTLRGFKRNRFIGDKIYFGQTELRWPIWEKYLQGIIFLELGEVAPANQAFNDFVFDYGGGLRFGFPPNHDLKLRLDWGTGRDLQGKRNYDFTISFLQVF